MQASTQQSLGLLMQQRGLDPTPPDARRRTPSYTFSHLRISGGWEDMVQAPGAPRVSGRTQSLPDINGGYMPSALQKSFQRIPFCSERRHSHEHQGTRNSCCLHLEVLLSVPIKQCWLMVLSPQNCPQSPNTPCKVTLQGPPCFSPETLENSLKSHL